MENKFQTSFIPKKPLISDQRVHVKHGTSVFMFISVLIFIASVAGAVFSVLWAGVLTKSQENYKAELAKKEESFNTSLIENLKKANTKIDLSMKLLKNHLAVSEIFNIINRMTVEGVRFTSFDFSSPTKNGEDIKISLKGTGKNFPSIAFQSDVLGQPDRYGMNRVLKNPLISDLALDTTGNVTFLFTATVNPADISYTNTLTQ